MDSLASLSPVWSLAVKGLLAAVVFLGLGALGRWVFLPRPIPGIPYNRKAAQSVLGDLPSMMKCESPQQWITEQLRRTGSPIFQLLPSPLTGNRPVVIVSDFREVQDILYRRHPEFDRSDATIRKFRLFGSSHQITHKTDDHFKGCRRLVQDLMTPSFLRRVAAPNIHASCELLVDLWSGKATAAAGRPFDAQEDMHFTTFDSVLAFTFGSNYPHRAAAAQMAHLQDEFAAPPPYPSYYDSSLEPSSSSSSPPLEVITFSSAPIHESSQGILDNIDMLMSIPKFPFPELTARLRKMTAKYRRAKGLRSSLICDQIRQAVGRMESEGAAWGDNQFRNAVDLVVDRERRFAKKEGRQPNYLSDVIEQELLGFVLAGHDTSFTTLLWGFKLLADHPEIQTRLRDEIRDAHRKERPLQRTLSSNMDGGRGPRNRHPSAAEIVDTPIPYLDAAVEEILRCANTVWATSRDSNVDTVVLGHKIPKHTGVLLVLGQDGLFPMGPGAAPRVPINEASRSPSCQAAAPKGVMSSDNGGGPKCDTWEGDPREFRPERWLDATGAFDNSAGPSLPFSAGVRGCFGRRLAHVEMRILITLVIWNFELLRCPASLSGYGAVEGITSKPKQAYVRLRKLA